ncbi:MAG TPA: hypothetical protein VIF83_04000 [Gemmatimonadaceae bacterium]|jgi:hypothetical protein
MRPAFLGIITACGILAGCATTPVSPVVGGVKATTQAEVARDFVLGPGQAASVEGTSLAVLFRSVNADSRCRVDVQCVWAGDAAVLLTVASAGTTGEQDVTLHTTLEPKAETVGQYEVRLVEVAPVPRSAAPIPAPTYRVTLRVTRVP